MSMWNQAVKKTLESGDDRQWSGTGRSAAQEGCQTLCPTHAYCTTQAIQALYPKLPCEQVKVLLLATMLNETFSRNQVAKMSLETGIDNHWSGAGRHAASEGC